MQICSDSTREKMKASKELPTQVLAEKLAGEGSKAVWASCHAENGFHVKRKGGLLRELYFIHSKNIRYSCLASSDVKVIEQ